MVTSFIRRSILPLVGVLFIATSPARAHFLFIRITPTVEAGPAAEVYFSERATAGDPKFVSKVTHTKLWSQTAPGKFQPLEVHAASDRLRAPLPAENAVAVIGQCEYGVLKRDVPFLLRYYPKAVRGAAADFERWTRCELVPLEIMPRLEGDTLVLTLLAAGKPVPNALFTTVDEDLDNEELTADKEGRVVWKPGRAGQYAVYAKLVTKTPGEHQGEKYDEVREFATLAFTWPLAGDSPDADAVALFQRAIAARAVWNDFPGFTAKIAGSVDGRYFSGKARVSAGGEVELKLDDTASREWLEDQLESLVLHRQAPGKRETPALQWADNDDRHPLGRLLTFMGGDFASTYRVREDEIIVVNRNLGPKNMTITVLDNERNAEGKCLPHAFTVQYWNAADGTLARSETVQNRWQRVGAFDLPRLVTVTAATSTGLSVRSFQLSDLELLPAKK